MTERIERLKNYFINNKEHHVFRKSCNAQEFTRKLSESGLSTLKKAVGRMKYVLECEEPVVFPFERIALIRTVTDIPHIYTSEELSKISEKYWFHDKAEVNNISVDYSELLYTGFSSKIGEIEGCIERYKEEGNTEKADYLKEVINTLNAVQDFSDKYREKALEIGNMEVAETFANIPANRPRNFKEALQMLRLLHFVLWTGNHYHNVFGRFDQYMYPFFRDDMEKGVIDYDSALELAEEFFLSCNRDTDLYPGIQQGDNGQSLMLGGLNVDGSESYNMLSEICLKASEELCVIDPKINLRVNKNTPIEIYELATNLTKRGLGFPQYSNDDIVIPALIDMGYSKEDAHNYTVAACWEFIIQGKGMEVVNLDALSFAQAVYKATVNDMENAKTFESFKEKVFQRIQERADEIEGRIKPLYLTPSPYISLMMNGCIENGNDVSTGCKYYNYGIHGAGLSTGADSMAAIKKHIYDNNDITVQQLIEAMNDNYEGHDGILYMMKNDSPKMGNNDDYVDNIAAELLYAFSDALKGKKNDRGGIYRAGTGSAMYYVWYGRDLPATPDGRKCGESLSANYSPSPQCQCKGPISIIQSFTKPDLKRVCNGGPLTLELHDTVFKNPEAIRKTAYMVKSFIDMGGHQLQLNSVNKGKLLDAQKHPENYRNLIVRVWGWSGYFVELDKDYQDHVIARSEYNL